MLSENMEKLLNRQITEELYAAQLYTSMECYCEYLSLVGCARWLRAQAEEEREHARKLIDFINDRNGRVRLGQIAAPPNEWSTPLALFEDAYRHEQQVSRYIADLVAAAEKETDRMSYAFLLPMLDEQVEEEDLLSTTADRFRLVGQDGGGLIVLDHELGERAK
jgi:ferritin